MADRIVLHIGAPKTGTTFLQGVVFHNKQRLAEAGVLVPGENRRAHGSAAAGVRGVPQRRHREQWQRIAEQVRASPGTVLLTNEWFSMATTDQARRALEELGSAEKHLVFTARDFVDQVPSAWQETLKLGESSSLEEFIASLDADEGRWRWSVLDPAAVLERWRDHLPPDRVHVVTMPSQGSAPGLLWQRFAQACGIDPDTCETHIERAKEGLSAESARLLQDLGPLLLDGLGADRRHWSETYRWVQQFLSQDLLVPRPGSRIRTSPDQTDALRERSRATVRALVSAGYHVVGDLADLTSAEPPPDARRPDEVTDREMLDLALPLVADLLTRVRQETLRAEAAERRLPAPSTGDQPPTRRRQPRPAAGPRTRLRAGLNQLRRLRPRA
jgi:hypothetical protein